MNTRSETVQHRPSIVRLAGIVLLASGLAVASLPTAAKEPSRVLGYWTLNNEQTVAAQPEDARQGFSFGRVTPSVRIGGVPIPLPSNTPAQESGRAEDPPVLRCADLQVGFDDRDVMLTFDSEREARWRHGKYRGMTTRLTSNRLTSRYDTMTRKVRKTFEVRSDGRLEVTVVVNPKSGKKITYKRVFDRAEPPASEDSTGDQSAGEISS